MNYDKIIKIIKKKKEDNSSNKNIYDFLKNKGYDDDFINGAFKQYNREKLNELDNKTEPNFDNYKKESYDDSVNDDSILKLLDDDSDVDDLDNSDDSDVDDLDNSDDSDIDDLDSSEDSNNLKDSSEDSNNLKDSSEDSNNLKDSNDDLNNLDRKPKTSIKIDPKSVKTDTSLKKNKILSKKEKSNLTKPSVLKKSSSKIHKNTKNTKNTFKLKNSKSYTSNISIPSYKISMLILIIISIIFFVLLIIIYQGVVKNSESKDDLEITNLGVYNFDENIVSDFKSYNLRGYFYINKNEKYVDLNITQELFHTIERKKNFDLQFDSKFLEFIVIHPLMVVQYNEDVRNAYINQEGVEVNYDVLDQGNTFLKEHYVYLIDTKKDLLTPIDYILSGKGQLHNYNFIYLTKFNGIDYKYIFNFDYDSNQMTFIIQKDDKKIIKTGSTNEVLNGILGDGDFFND